MDRQYLAQRLINEGRLTFEELTGLLEQKSFDAVEEQADSLSASEENPVKAAVMKAAGDELQMEAETYGEYMALFMGSLMEFLDAPAVVDPVPVPPDESCETFYAVSQRMDGDLSVVSGIMAEEREFVELASRYSQEKITGAESELAIDSLEEFLNVVNGVFSIQAAERGQEIDLEVPRYDKLMNPEGHQQLLLRIYVDFGIFYVVLSSDEFM